MQQLRGVGAILRQSAVTLFAPPRCLLCLGAGTWLCYSCQQTVARVTYSAPCIGCHTVTAARGLTCNRCRHKTSLQGVQSVGPYTTYWLQRGVHWLKFRGIRDVAPTLAYTMTWRLPLIAPLSQLQQQALFVPIPLHPRRRRHRGYNQSEDLARYLSTLTAIPYLPPLLRRVRSTWSQALLPTELRSHNMADVFVSDEPLPVDRSLIILVDDVTTSGSTLSAAAAALPHHRDRQVWGLTVARG